MKRRSMGAAALVVTVALMLSGCSQAGQAVSFKAEGAAETVKTSVVVVMSPESEPTAGFDPAYGWGAGEHVHEPLIQSTLTVTTADLKIDKDLATEYTVSDDGLLWTVKLRTDVKFTDGTALTAADVAFTYNKVKELSTVADFTMLERAEAQGEDTVFFHMAHAYSIWPYTMAIVGIVPEHAYSESYGQNPVGSGRYVMKQWDKGQQVIFEANPDYYGEAPQMQKVTVLFMEEDGAFAAAKSGQADLVYTAASYAQQQVNGYSLLSCETVDNRGVNLPSVPDNGVVGNNVTCDPVVRKAMNIGLDRQKLIDNVLGGYGSPAYSVCDQMPWYSSDMEVSCDPEQAKTLLEEGGWKQGADGVREKDGVRAELTLIYPSGDSVRQEMAAELSAQLTALGFACTVQDVSWDTAYDRAQRELLVWGWGAHTPMELYNIYHTVADTGLARYSPYANSQVDSLMDEALASPNLEESYGLWQQAQSSGIAEETPWLWLANINHLYWTREGLKVAEQKLHPHGHGWSIVNNVDQWSWQ